MDIIAISKLLFYWILRSWFREANKMHAGFLAKCPLVLLDFKKIVTSQGFTENIWNILIHNNAFSFSPVVTRRRTDRNDKKQQAHFVAFFSEIPQGVTGWMYIFRVWCYIETDWILCCVCYCTAYWVYRSCTVCKWTVLTVITETEWLLCWVW